MGKIKCLGREFSSEEDRRFFFRELLREKLPELKPHDGSPLANDEDIINLSDPPYYTPCPNPWLDELIGQWESEKDKFNNRIEKFKVTDPYSADVSEGKNNPIYNAHSYHTKVPHPAIMRYILHYTQPGDIVLDGFGGTGMTGVAAQLCGNPDELTKHLLEKEFETTGRKITWGTRRAICGDLSPIASFISYNYNQPVNRDALSQLGEKTIQSVQKECGWMFQTKDEKGNSGHINFWIFSDVFLCPNCRNEIVFYNAVVDQTKREIRDLFKCSSCQSELTRKKLERKFITYYDNALEKSTRFAAIVPVLINFTVKGKRFEKTPDQDDYALLEKVAHFKSPYWFPTDRMPDGEESRRNDDMGFTHVHHYQIAANNFALAKYWSLCASDRVGNALKLAASAANPNFSRMRRFRPDGKGGRPLAGTLYVSSLTTPQNCINSISRNLEFIQKAFQITKLFSTTDSAVYTSSCTKLNIADNSIDYIFTDPPFGANIMYSELNFLWESWLKVFTNNSLEVIENKTQNKTILEYQNLMWKCFQEYYRVLKYGNWMTVEFSNTSAAVWNGIQTAIQKAGFVIASVTALDKQQGSFKAVTTATAVKQDLVISCYKPSENLVAKFKEGNLQQNVWAFVTEYLDHLPVQYSNEKKSGIIIERTPRILFDKMISFFLLRSLPIPIDAKDFQAELVQKFVLKDGMIFTIEQSSVYQNQTNQREGVQLPLIVTSESDAIEWLRDLLRVKPAKYQDIMPDFRRIAQSVRRGDQLPELQDILNENFIQDETGRWRTPNVNEAKDRAAVREKLLMKEFNSYLLSMQEGKSKRLKEVRVESLRTGFKACWQQKDFKTIVSVAELIPQNILLEDEQLLMYYDIAKDRL